MDLENVLTMDLQFFAEEDGNSGSDTDNQSEASNNNDGDRQPDQHNDQQTDQKTFTQDQLNGIVTRESRTAVEKALKELGFDQDFDSAKDGIQAYKEWQESQLSDQEKLTKQLQTTQTEKQELEATMANIKAENEALKMGVAGESVEDVVALAKAKVTDEVTIEEAIKGVVEKYPNFLHNQPDQETENKRPRIVNPASPKTKSGSSDDALESVLEKYQ